MEPPMNWKYEVIIYWSNDDASFIAEVPELPGCMAHGATQSDALNSANEAIALWLATAQELGRAVPEPKGRRLLYA
jgi:predicted RNase H-like HicB family nuclease